MIKVYDIAGAFLPVNLGQMERVELMNRTDTKFLGNISGLANLLTELLQHYYILEIDEERVFPYQTMYYDTVDFRFYLMHHNGKLNRVKIRKRKYEISNLQFLEIKVKNNKGKTEKKRIRITAEDNFLSEKEINFIALQKPCCTENLEAKLISNFQRITLVGKEINERITIDIDVSFSFPLKIPVQLNNLAIIEVKSNGYDKSTLVPEKLKTHGFVKSSFSKYCMGALLLYPELKYNNFKSNFNVINKINKNQIIKINEHDATIEFGFRDAV